MTSPKELDSDDSLPDLLDLFPITSTEIQKGDIVWAKFKNLYWPALVRQIYKKEKKISIWYTDEPGKNFKLPMKNIVKFGDFEKSREICSAAAAAGVAEPHDGLAAHAHLYLTRREQGKVDDPMKFFDQTYPYLLMEEWFTKNPGEDKEMFSDIKINPLYIDHRTASKGTPVRKKLPSNLAVSYDSEVEETDSEESAEENGEEVTPKKKLFENLCVPNSDTSYVKKIIDCITSGTADEYLSFIMTKKVSSIYYKYYLEAIQNDKKKLDLISYGPVTDMAQLRKIIFYLLDLYKKEMLKNKNHKSSIVPPSTIKPEDAQFVRSVWLPEAIIYAISQVKEITLEEANKLFSNTGGLDLIVSSSEMCANTTQEDVLNISNMSIEFQNILSRNPKCVLIDILKEIHTDNLDTVNIVKKFPIDPDQKNVGPSTNKKAKVSTSRKSHPCARKARGRNSWCSK